MKYANVALILLALPVVSKAQNRKHPELFDVPEIRSSWDDLTDGIETKDDWRKRRAVLKQRYLELLRDQHKPQQPPMDLQVHEEVVVDGVYRRKLISYAVEADERALRVSGHSLGTRRPSPGDRGPARHLRSMASKQVCGARSTIRTRLISIIFVVAVTSLSLPSTLCPVTGFPPKALMKQGSFTGSIPSGLQLESSRMSIPSQSTCYKRLEEVDNERIGALGHSLGGHGTFFLAAYDDRIKASACNCGASFFRHNPARRSVVARPLVCLLQANSRRPAQG